MSEKQPMLKRQQWKTFQESGLLWWINMFLHTFGWCIVLQFEDDKIVEVYPAKTKFRGFDQENNTKGYERMQQNFFQEPDWK